MLLNFYNIKLYYYNSIKNSTVAAEIVVIKAVCSEDYQQQLLPLWYYYYYYHHNIIIVYLYIFSFIRVIRTLSEVYCQNPDKVAICQNSCISLLSLLLIFLSSKLVETENQQRERVKPPTERVSCM